MTDNKRTQRRGICCMCGRLQALKGNNMVAHGYTLHYGSQAGNCFGVGRPHYGDPAAVSFLKDTIELMTAELEELPGRIEAAIAENESGKRVRDLKAHKASLPLQIKALQQRLDGWKEVAPIEVDLDVEEREQKELREAERKTAKTAKAAAAADKEAKRQEREAKTAKKWAGILSMNWHQALVHGEVVAEWQAEYSSRDEMKNDHSKRLNAYLDTLEFEDLNDRISMTWGAGFRVRTGQGKSGKQLHKY